MNDADDPIDEAFAAYLRSCDDGSGEDRETFVSRYPEMADRLRALMTLADSIESFVSLDGDSSGASHVHVPAVARVRGDADTLNFDAALGLDDDLNMTLPLANREPGDMGPTLPFQLGDYTLKKVIGRGGMGVVYLAVQNHLDRQVAVKMIRSGALASEAEVVRFYTEAKAAAALEHRNIVSVFQFGHCAGHHYFSMEFVAGTDLDKKIRDKPLDETLAARYVRDVARAIHHAHQRGVLHRDLKPANVLIDLNDEVRVTDFGLAKQTNVDSSVTGSGAAIGTPSYMAPEQASGNSDRACHRSDVYSLGAILFAAIAGRPPFQNESTLQTLLEVVHQAPPLLRTYRPGVSADIETIVAKCLEKLPSSRYATADSLADDLDAFLRGDPISARPRSTTVRALTWFKRVPLVAALTGRRMIDSTDAHRRAQTVILCLAIFLPIVTLSAMLVVRAREQRMPSSVRVAGGLDGGVYDDLSGELARRIAGNTGSKVAVIRSGGSIDNHELLVSGDVDIAPMQAIAMTGDRLGVIAPLFYEAIHIMVRGESDIGSTTDINGHQIAVGLPGSGSRLAAEMVLESLDLTPKSAPRVSISWPDLNRSGDADLRSLPDVAVICIGKGSRLGASMLSGNRWRLLPLDSAIEISLQHPSLKPMTIMPADYPEIELPTGGISTVGTTAFLVGKFTAPDDLVTQTLIALYQSPPISNGLIARRQAMEWQNLSLHRAARRFYEANATNP